MRRYVPIRNMDRAVKFYTETLGGKVLMRDTGEMKDMWASIKLAGAEFWLIPPSKREKRELSYSVFAVKDIRSAVSDLKAKGRQVRPRGEDEQGHRRSRAPSHGTRGLARRLLQGLGREPADALAADDVDPGRADRVLTHTRTALLGSR